jgi:hypothetical protein
MSGYDPVERMEVTAMADRKSAETDTKQYAKRTTGKASRGFTAEERAAMRDRAQELKTEARANKDRAAGEGTAADEAKIAALVKKAVS